MVFAGLIPALEENNPNLQMATFTPDSYPLQNLENCLAEAAFNPQSANPNLVIVVDQFEETFTLCNDEQERLAFLEKLLGLIESKPDSPTPLLILTMRADFWGDVAGYRNLKERMQANQELISPMDSTELRRAMELQAGVVGLRFERDLANQILDDVAGEPGAMPLLQHALLELWLRRHGRWLRHEQYRAIGGVQRAIAETAEKIYDDLSQQEQNRVRNIFVRLTRLDDEAAGGEMHRDTRRRVNVAELVPAASDPAITKTLLKHLADARLIVTSVNPVTEAEEAEVAHEALIRHWPRLQAWLDEDRTSLRVRERIRQAAQLWDEGGRNDDLIQHRGVQLEEAKSLSHSPRFALNTLEQAYVDACEALRLRLLAEEEEERMRELRAARRLNATLIGGVVVASLLTIIALFLFRQANLARERAEQQTRLARAEQLAAEVRVARQVSPQLGLLLAVQANQAIEPGDPTVPAAEEALWEVLSTTGGSVLHGHQAPVKDVALTQDGRWLISGDEAGQVGVWDLEAPDSAQTVRFFPIHKGSAQAVAVSPDGQYFASAGLDGKTYLWGFDQSTGRSPPASKPWRGSGIHRL